jgi:putative oxidoreductase
MLDFLSRFSVGGLTVFRVVIAVLFMLHGAQKLFGLFGKEAVELVSVMGAAGIIEFVAGVMIIIGLFTRLWSVLSFLLMVIAYVSVHAPQGWNPLTNGGELAILFAASFLLLALMGGGRFSLNHVLFRKDLL